MAQSWARGTQGPRALPRTPHGSSAPPTPFQSSPPPSEPPDHPPPGRRDSETQSSPGETRPAPRGKPAARGSSGTGPTRSDSSARQTAAERGQRCGAYAMWTRGAGQPRAAAWSPRDSEQEAGRRAGGRPHASPRLLVTTGAALTRSSLSLRLSCLSSHHCGLCVGTVPEKTRNQSSGPGSVGLPSGWPAPNFLSLTPQRSPLADKTHAVSHLPRLPKRTGCSKKANENSPVSVPG